MPDYSFLLLLFRPHVLSAEKGGEGVYGEKKGEKEEIYGRFSSSGRKAQIDLEARRERVASNNGGIFTSFSSLSGN